MKINPNINNLNEPIVMERDQAAQQTTTQTSNTGGISDATNLLESPAQSAFSNAFDQAVNSALNTAGELTLDQESIASKLGVDLTPGDDQNTVGNQREAGKTTSGDGAGKATGPASGSDPSGSANAGSRLAEAKEGLLSFLNASGQGISDLPETAQLLLSGQLDLPSDQERSDNLLKNAGLGGLSEDVVTSVFDAAESSDQNVSAKYGKGSISSGSMDVVSNKREERINEDGSKTIKSGSVTVDGDGVRISEGTLTISPEWNYLERTSEYQSTDTIFGRDGSETKTETTETTVVKKNEDGSETTTTTTTTKTTTKNADGTTTTKTETNTETKTTPPSNTPSSSIPAGDDYADLPEVIQQSIDSALQSLRNAQPNTGSGNIDPNENDESFGGTPYNDPQKITLFEMGKIGLIGQPAEDGPRIGTARPISTGPSGNIDFGPDSTQTGYTGEARGGDPTDLEVGTTTLKPAESSEEENEEEEESN